MKRVSQINPELDYTKQLTKLISLLINQLTFFFEEAKLNISQFSTQFLGIYTKLRVLEQQSMFAFEFPFSQLLSDFQTKLISQKLKLTDHRRACSFLVQSKDKSIRKMSNDDLETTITNNRVKTESSTFTSVQYDDANRTIEFQKKCVPQQIFCEMKRQNFIKNNKPPLYLFENPQTLEVQQIQNQWKEIPMQPHVQYVYKNSSFKIH